MSKLVKGLITDNYASKFDGVTDAMVVSIRGVESNQTNKFRAGLAAHEIKVSVVKNSLARKAFAGGDLEPLNDMLTGASALVTGGESAVAIAREILKWVDDMEGLEIKGAVMEGTVFGPDQIKALSKYPTKAEAQAQVVGLLVAGHQGVLGAATGIGGQLVSQIEALEEKLEKGETVTKVA